MGQIPKGVISFHGESNIIKIFGETYKTIGIEAENLLNECVTDKKYTLEYYSFPDKQFYMF
jgi:hypothetical protein